MSAFTKLSATSLLTALLLAPAGARAQKVFINYSNQTSNAVCAGGVESTYAGDNASRTQALLVGYGFQVKISDDFYGSNDAAASWGATSFVSVHSNAGGGHGTETLQGWYGDSAALASHIQAGLLSKMPYQSRGVKPGSCQGGRCRVLNYSGQTAALAEVLFHDCCTSSGYKGHPPSEGSYLVTASSRQVIATGFAAGICDYYGKTCTSTPPPTTGSIKGVVYQNGDMNQHVAPATVRVSTGASATYDGNSVWSFTVPAGSGYTITASATGYETATKTCNAVAAGATTWCSIELVPVAPPSTGFIKGVVYRNGDTTDRVVPARVTLSTGESVSFTDPNVLWSFEVPAGSGYAVNVTADGYNDASRDCGPVVAGATTWCSVEVNAVAASAATTGVLAGMVYRSGNKAQRVATATITVNTGATVTYDGSTSWSFDLPPATYSVTVSAEGYRTRTFDCPEGVTVGGSARCDVELQLEEQADPGDSTAAESGAESGPAAGSDSGGCSSSGSTALWILVLPLMLILRRSWRKGAAS